MYPKDWDSAATRSTYFEQVHSPFGDQTTKRRFLKRARPHFSKRKSAIDLGTGIGNLVPTLSRNYRRITAIDYSPAMIEFCRRNHRYGNVDFKVGDMRDLKEHACTYDAAFAINSILGPKRSDAINQFRQIHGALKERGTLIAVLPAMESEAHVAMCVYDILLEQTGDRRRARKLTRDELEADKLDFLFAKYDSEDGTQKWYYRFEILRYCDAAGFRKVSIERLPYPWRTLENIGVDIEVDDQPWDWFVIARK